ncbi:hypothetical protein Y11_p0311 (plasmid) [Yersinia enterocolitica subsp. palearctica Y11]|uniref:Uncharacterized protein n=1 Tax=Yersinia enterocolitica subsp. palearctica serotype O:3 (strain DSM 13030 / CIP 106945 / Y11) TaxID=930944 RepID=A0A0H3NW89_YERE1|nr:hypothetical protein Y11_p0311 [Yersinia enterocolitica subsp. palearctica Y11]
MQWPATGSPSEPPDRCPDVAAHARFFRYLTARQDPTI